MLKESFVLRVLAITFIFIALPLIVVSFILFQSGYESALKQMQNELKNAATERTHALIHNRPISPSILGEIELFLNLDTTFPITPNLEMSQKLHEIAEKLPKGAVISLISPHEENNEFPILASSDVGLAGKGTMHSHDRLATSAQKGLTEFIQTFYREKEKKYVFFYVMAKPIFAASDGKLLGYIVVSANIDSNVDQLFLDAKREYPNLNFALLGREGVILKASDPKMMGNYFEPLTEEEKKIFYGRRATTSQTDLLAPNPLPNNLIHGKPSFEFSRDGQTELAYHVPPFFDIGESFMAYASKEALFRGAISRFLIIYNVYGLIILIGGATTLLLSHYFGKPLHNFAALMEHVRSGDLASRYERQPWGFEINALGTIFNSTLDSVLLHMQDAENYRVQKETRRKEIEIGYEVQRKLIPTKMPELKTLDLAAFHQSSEVAGGDFYDVIPKDHTQIALLVSDIATLGISACLYSLGVRSILRAYTMLYTDVGEILTATNHMFSLDILETGMYSTLIYGIYDQETKEFTYCACGHIPGLIKHKDGTVSELASPGIAIGLSPDTKYIPKKIELSPGDIVLFFTDGIIDARNAQGEKFTLARLKNILLKTHQQDSQIIVESVINEIKQFSSLTPQEEDWTLLVARIKS